MQVPLDWIIALMCLWMDADKSFTIFTAMRSHSLWSIVHNSWRLRGFFSLDLSRFYRLYLNRAMFWLIIQYNVEFINQILLCFTQTLAWSCVIFFKKCLLCVVSDATLLIWYIWHSSSYRLSWAIIFMFPQSIRFWLQT